MFLEKFLGLRGNFWEVNLRLKEFSLMPMKLCLRSQVLKSWEPSWRTWESWGKKFLQWNWMLGEQSLRLHKPSLRLQRQRLRLLKKNLSLGEVNLKANFEVLGEKVKALVVIGSYI
jgi:hypothetical protein